MNKLELSEVVSDKVTEAKPFVLVCIPAYNEEKTIAKIVLKVQKYADKVVVCDGGSTDISDEIAEQGSKMLFQSWLRTSMCLVEWGSE